MAQSKYPAAFSKISIDFLLFSVVNVSAKNEFVQLSSTNNGK